MAHQPARAPFVRHDGAGRITEWGRMEPAHIAAEAAAIGGILEGEGAPDTHYVDLSGQAPRLRPRRRLVVEFDAREVLAGAPARIVLPPGSAIALAGPLSATVRAGGAVDLVVRVPGVYAVTLEAWPLRPAVTSLTVLANAGPVPVLPAGAIVVGPGLEAVRAQAKDLATLHYSDLALLERPAGLQPADLLKVAEAERVRAGGVSAWITAEALDRGTTARELADKIASESARTVARETERTRVTQAVARAATESDVVAALAAAGLAFRIPPGAKGPLT